MDLAKPCLDVGVFTNRVDEMRRFYEADLGLPYDHLLKLGGGTHQHRLEMRGSVFKLNHHREPLGPAPSCFRRLVIADPAAEAARLLCDPDGAEVEIVPPGHQGVSDIGVVWATNDIAVLARLLADGFGAQHLEGDRLRVGSTVLALVQDDAATHVGPMRAIGLRYLTVQVRDVVAEHRRLLEVGWTEGSPPVRLGDVAYVSFVRDPLGSWVEVSQRASLTGPLPEG